MHYICAILSIPNHAPIRKVGTWIRTGTQNAHFTESPPGLIESCGTYFFYADDVFFFFYHRGIVSPCIQCCLCITSRTYLEAEDAQIYIIHCSRYCHRRPRGKYTIYTSQQPESLCTYITYPALRFSLSSVIDYIWSLCCMHRRSPQVTHQTSLAPHPTLGGRSVLLGFTWDGVRQVFLLRYCGQKPPTKKSIPHCIHIIIIHGRLWVMYGYKEGNLWGVCWEILLHKHCPL